MYKSLDYQAWNFSHSLHSLNGTGMWECLDFFPVPITGALVKLKSLHGANVSLQNVTVGVGAPVKLDSITANQVITFSVLLSVLILFDSCK